MTARARNRDTRKRAMKALSFQTEVSKITRPMLKRTENDIASVLMITNS